MRLLRHQREAARLIADGSTVFAIGWGGRGGKTVTLRAVGLILAIRRGYEKAHTSSTAPD